MKPRLDFARDSRKHERFELRPGDASITVRVRYPDELRVLDLRCVGTPTELSRRRDLGDAPRWIRMDPSRACCSAQTNENDDDRANDRGLRERSPYSNVGSFPALRYPCGRLAYIVGRRGTVVWVAGAPAPAQASRGR